MALEAGSAVDGTGLAGAIAEKYSEAFGSSFKVDQAYKAIDAEAAAIVEYLVANAEVAVSELPAGTPIDPPGIGTIA